MGGRSSKKSSDPLTPIETRLQILWEFQENSTYDLSDSATITKRPHAEALFVSMSLNWISPTYLPRL
jgi:hypothetical protein